MAISLVSAPQTVARLHPEGSCSKERQEVVPESISWNRPVSAALQTRTASTSWSQMRRNYLVRLQCRAGAYKVEIEHEGQKHMLEVPEGESILSVAIDAGLTVPYDCQLGVCMTCPAKLEKGSVDQDQGMLSDDVKEKGYALMCVAYPTSDCFVRSIPEEELLSLQLATADD